MNFTFILLQIRKTNIGSEGAKDFDDALKMNRVGKETIHH